MSLRWRLALLYTLVTAALLIPGALLAYSLRVRAQYQGIDESLVSTAQHLEDQLRSTSGGDHAVPALASEVSVGFFDRASGPVVTHGASSGPLLTPAEVLGRHDGPAWPAVAGLLFGNPGPGKGGFATVNDPEVGSRVRFYALPAGQDAGLGYVLAWKSLQAVDASARFLGIIFAVVAGGGVFAAGGGTFVVAGNVLRPVSVMTGTAHAIAGSRGFSRRVPEMGRADELGRLARTFNEMLSSLEEAYRMEQRFVADAAHELRAPLTAIQGNIELVLRDPEMPAAERREAFTYLDTEARRLSRIVGELLTLARADAGQALECRPVELDRVLLDALAEMKMRAPDHELQVEGIEPASVSGDRDRLKEVVLNLVDNALKYTPPGGHVGVSLSTDASTSTLAVRDSGAGIGAEDLPHIFERFYRANPARSQDPGGSGLGLAIVRWIVDQHSGEITVESAPGKGTTVRVRLPLLEQADQPAPARASPSLAPEKPLA